MSISSTKTVKRAPARSRVRRPPREQSGLSAKDVTVETVESGELWLQFGEKLLNVTADAPLFDAVFSALLGPGSLLDRNTWPVYQKAFFLSEAVKNGWVNVVKAEEVPVERQVTSLNDVQGKESAA